MNSPTPTARIQPYIPGKFDTLIEGLEYAAKGNSGFNFFTGKGELKSVLTFTELRDRAVDTAHRLVGIT